MAKPKAKLFEAREPKTNLFVFISEPIKVGSEGANMRLRVSQNMLAYFMTEYEHVGHEVFQHLCE